MQRKMQGTVHGRTIQLDADPQMADGSKVEIILRAKRLPGPPPGWTPESGETAAGMLADCWTREDDEILETIHRDRKQDARRELAD